MTDAEDLPRLAKAPHIAEPLRQPDEGAVIVRSDKPVGALAGALTAVRRRLAEEWRSTGLYAASLNRPVATGFAARPRDPRPVDPTLGRDILAGRWTLADASIDLGPGEDPFDRPSPSRRFATELHRFSWTSALLAQEGGRREALRIVLAWTRQFDQPNAFVWSAEVLERRVFNLACAAPVLADGASDAETAALAQSLARQARRLLHLDAGPARQAERLIAIAVAGAALTGRSGERLLKAALDKLGPALDAAAPPDGSLRTRSPEQGLELLLDLLALDDGLLQRGGALPEAVARALDRLGAGLRFHTLGDGRLPRMNGGGAADPNRIAAALDLDDAAGSAFSYAPHGGVHRLSGRTLQVVVDAAPAPAGAWSVAACAHPLAVEILSGSDRLITNAGWTPDSGANPALRLTPAGSTVTLGDGSAGAPLMGARARALGPRLEGGAKRVDSRRQQTEAGVWLELAHDGWAQAFGLIHERRLFLDPALDELRGEDAFVRAPGAKPPKPPLRRIPYAARFHLAPGARASLARDGRSVLLRGPSERGWWLRNDAPEVSIEASTVIDGGLPRSAQQIVLRGHLDPLTGGRIRWKLSLVTPEPAPRLPLPRREAVATPAAAVASSA